MSLNSPEFRAKVADQAKQQQLEEVLRRGEELKAQKVARDEAIKTAENRGRAERVLELAYEIAAVALGEVSVDVNLVLIKDRSFYTAHKRIAQGWVIDQFITPGGYDERSWSRSKSCVDETTLGTNGRIYKYSYYADYPLAQVEQRNSYHILDADFLTPIPVEIDRVENRLAAFVARHGL